MTKKIVTCHNQIDVDGLAGFVLAFIPINNRIWLKVSDAE